MGPFTSTWPWNVWLSHWMFDWATEVACYNRLKNHVVVVDFSILSATFKKTKKTIIFTQYISQNSNKKEIKNLFQNPPLKPRQFLLRPLRCEAARCAPETRPNTCPAGPRCSRGPSIIQTSKTSEMIYVDTHNQLNIQTFNQCWYT